MQQEQEGTTPLHSVKERCRMLRQEWEGMMHNADIISSDVIASLKAQEVALVAERKQVQAIKQETHDLRRSFLQKTQEQEEKVLAERELADQIKVNVSNQLGEVKKLQCHLTIQLENLRTSIEKFKGSKQQDSAYSLPVSSSTTQLCRSVLQQPIEHLDSEIVLRSKDDDAGVRGLLSGSSTNPAGFILDSDSKPLRPKDIKESAMMSQNAIRQIHLEHKYESLRDKGYMHCKESGLNSRGSLLLACPDGHEVDGLSVKIELNEEAGCSWKDKALKTFSYDAAPCVSSLDGGTDELDNILLSDRLEVLLQKIYQGQSSNDDDGRNYKLKFFKRKKSLGSDRLAAKKKWEVPIEVALQEDAPGLLEKLQERGLLEDMTIYGAVCEDAFGTGEDDFKDLECIARKIWGTPSGLFKGPQLIRQHALGLFKDPAYCLSCLVSLIDQAKSLRQRNWPVEWGWCRELQAFIFVFDKHNRVVLERPEYGNATYFFELVQQLPVKWQVLRLIRILTVTALGKTALLENKPLEVGFELTANESKILEDFGWAPGTGLGSFLNFCDRVVHDVKEDDNMEWRQKIGKCLMDGYDKGRIITPALPLKLLKGVGNTSFEDEIKPSTMLLT